MGHDSTSWMCIIFHYNPQQAADLKGLQHVWCRLVFSLSSVPMGGCGLSAAVVQTATSLQAQQVNGIKNKDCLNISLTAESKQHNSDQFSLSGDIKQTIFGGFSYLSRGCLCVEHRRSRRTRRSCRKSCQTLIRSTDTGYSCTLLARCRFACLRLPDRRWGACCWLHPPGTHSGRPGSPAHTDKSHSYTYLQGAKVKYILLTLGWI